MTSLKPIPLNAKDGKAWSEEQLQRLLFAHPNALPIAEIDDSFSGLIPLCMELDTPAGSIDVVFVTPSGRLALLETKLWRNPEARREVIGQILDYAKEMTNWDYSRLDAKVRQARKNSDDYEFPGIAEWVARIHPALVLHRFQDAVTKSLMRGDYLLLVAGDGIREGVGAIAKYLDRNSALHFTFGLVECAIYENPLGGFFVQSRVLAQTIKLTRTVLTLADGRLLEIEPDEPSDVGPDDRPDLVESREKFQKFWAEWLTMLRVEDSQSMPEPARSTNQYFAMPKGSNSWISAYLAQSEGQAGVYLRIKRDPVGEYLFDALVAERDAVDEALGVRVEWHSREKPNQNWVIVRKSFRGVLMVDSREAVQKWLADNIERFVAVFRPRIEHLLREQELPRSIV